MSEYDELASSIYDAYFSGISGDVDFYLNEAKNSGGGILELGCGTGRISIPIAEAGVRVDGLDPSPAMLKQADAKLQIANSEVTNLLRLQWGDMRSFEMNRRYKLVIIPYRSFMHLKTLEDQVMTLTTIFDHLKPGGSLIFNIYDPMMELVLMEPIFGDRQYDTEFRHPKNGHLVKAWYTRLIDIVPQIITQHFWFEEHGDNGIVVNQYETDLTLRYTHRYEMHYLLEMCGFQISHLYGDFDRHVYTGAEQIWIASKPK